MKDFGAGCFWLNVGAFPAMVPGVTIKMTAGTCGFLADMKGGGIALRVVVLVSWPFAFAIC